MGIFICFTSYTELTKKRTETDGENHEEEVEKLKEKYIAELREFAKEVKGK